MSKPDPKKTYYQIIGCTVLNLRTWDGTAPVQVMVPTECPSRKVQKEAVDFILGELDDHDGMDELKKLWGMSQEELESLA